MPQYHVTLLFLLNLDLPMDFNMMLREVCAKHYIQPVWIWMGIDEYHVGINTCTMDSQDVYGFRFMLCSLTASRVWVHMHHRYYGLTFPPPKPVAQWTITSVASPVSFVWPKWLRWFIQISQTLKFLVLVSNVIFTRAFAPRVSIQYIIKPDSSCAPRRIPQKFL